MATGGKCKYLLYVASTVATDALANRWRCAATFLRVLCLSKEDDHLSLQFTALSSLLFGADSR